MPAPKNGKALPIRILLVDAHTPDRAVLRATLEASTHLYRITERRTLARARAALARDSKLDLAVVACTLPDGSGFDLLPDLRQHPAQPAAVLLAHTGSEQLALAALRGGMQDYVSPSTHPDPLDYLARSLPQIVAEARARRQREAEATLADSHLRLQQIVEGSTVPTFVLDQKHVVTHWNKACAALTGVPAAEVVGTRRQWSAFYPQPRPVMADLILDGASEQEVARFYRDHFRPSPLVAGAYEAEAFFPHFGDDGRWLYFTAAPLLDRQGRMIGALETLQDVTEQRRAEAALRESEERYRRLSITDSLTGLYNSRHFHEQLQKEVRRCKRYGGPLSLLVLDIDNFKQINDAFGHLEGDLVLARLASIIRACLRTTDSGYRHGGEEFAVLLPETELENARSVAERLRAEFATIPHGASAAPRSLPTTISVGVAQYVAGEDHISLLRRADNCTYAAKRKGKNCVVVAVTPRAN